MGNVYLTCAHCKVEFLGTVSQIKHHKHDGSQAYCSDICRRAATANRMRKPVPRHGPCPSCGSMFESRTSKIYCSHKCYLASPAFAAMREANVVKAAKSSARNMEEFLEQNTINCMECATPFYSPPAKQRKFCGHLCYRGYMAKRFDRWVASPERIALPQNFDEFLIQTELPCLVEGCGWVGKSLSAHMNSAHGVSAREFKRAAGFNIKTGVISSDLFATLSQRTQTLVGIKRPLDIMPEAQPQTMRYVSLEGREHRRKARAIARGGPSRKCKGCGVNFEQSSPFGKAKYCSIGCRDADYATRTSERKFTMKCFKCGSDFLGNYSKNARHRRGLPVSCSLSCRNAIVAGYKRPRIRTAQEKP